MSESAYVTDFVGNRYRTKALAKNVVSRVCTGDFPGIVFVRWASHGEELAEEIGRQFNNRVEVPLVTAKMPRKERATLINRLSARDETLPVVVATSVWSTGIDIATVRWVMRAGGGQAAIGQIQEAGRGSRMGDESKEGCVIIDVVEPGQRWEGHRQTRDALWQQRGYLQMEDRGGLLNSDQQDSALTQILLAGCKDVMPDISSWEGLECAGVDGGAGASAFTVVAVMSGLCLGIASIFYFCCQSL
jgi:RecG-like helicase